MSQTRFRRSLYQENQRLTAADLENQQRYDREKRQLLNHAFYGAGVIDGFDVQYDAIRGGILLSPGLALDHLGQELHLAEQRFYSERTLCENWPDGVREAVLGLQYTEQTAGEGFVLQPDGTHQSVPNRMEEDVRLVCQPDPAAPEPCLLLAHCRIHKDALGAPHIRAVSPAAQRPAVYNGVSSGVLTIRPLADFWDGGTVYSDEISHGLGPGAVAISLSVEGWMDHRACLVSGETELFLPGFKTAVLLYPEDGTFRAAVRQRSDSHDSGILRIYWHAVRTNADYNRTGQEPERVPVSSVAAEMTSRNATHQPLSAQYSPVDEPACAPLSAESNAAEEPVGVPLSAEYSAPEEPAYPPLSAEYGTFEKTADSFWESDSDAPSGLPERCTLEPRVAFLLPGETVHFQLCGDDGFLSAASLRFQAEGGLIDERGRYTAPMQDGVYQVCAATADQQTYWATVFVKKRR